MILNDRTIFTILLVVALFIAILITKNVIKKFSRLRAIDANRLKVVLNLSYLAIYLIGAVVIAFIWGVELKQFTVFISSVLAVIGVGFFAQWSLLSNLTASVILFFNHPVRLGDRIKILDKDFNWVGVVTDITGFYVFMTTDDGEKISLPNSLVMQKGIQMLPLVKDDKEDQLQEDFVD
jgi:small-conductance mechanosensitive channel